ncbi:sensor histidine kinase [Cellulomonas fimi]|uniref:histidine kinase n=1 Tax=Cellulomonas fimi (strain ATCC 484 / DSM 20113 / JCM 1341 / CCUG 24087 / LMG 16345 / NBRC 15513 / NCIMB 8980 / NCTC 7547 / NRS-133) TaxID=590998 RepID=F4H547_CELFA|nr:sensor histidine kinase [Cellulomonas fimi]AEE46653.1 integral membrane sensor signal transduction histidine kinase [Cellulomonas fimi ATCC 484]NNH08603.1 sensor histidine kinase [Cellulomonas fimi]VEH33782.1 Nitrate/nitrite sensor protein narX [Cellulomonas fimi]
MTWWDRVLRWEDSHRFTVDVFGTGLLLLVVLVASVDVAASTSGTARGLDTFVVSFLMVAPLAWRRVRPAASAATIYTVALLQMLLVTPLVLPADFAVLVALYSVTVHGPRWAHRVAIWGAIVGGVLLPMLMDDWWDPAGAVAMTVFVWSVALAVWAFGLARRSRRETLEALVDRAEQLERERDQQAQIATAAERARIAREMHDIVAHSLTVMIAQADGGRYAADADPAAATRALGTIAETGRAALTDMRRLLGVLRAGPPVRTGAVPVVTPASAPAAPSAAERATTEFAPQPAVEDVPGLVDQMRASGLRVSLVRMGTPRHLPPGVGLTAYRIAQEALTNVLKHAGPDPRVTVLLSWRPDDVTLEIADDGRGAAADSDGLGHGLLGMRERAAMFGGSVSTGPRPGGGYRVRAVLPTGPAHTDGRGAAQPGRTTPTSGQDDR